MCQCIWRNGSLLSRLYLAKSLAKMNPAVVWPEKQHLEEALRMQASHHLLCEKIFEVHFWLYPCIFCLVTKGFTRALCFHFEIKYLNTSSSCAYLAISELLQAQGRTPGQWSVSSWRIVCQTLCQKAVLAVSLGLVKKALCLPLCMCSRKTQLPPSLWLGVPRKNRRKYSLLKINLAYGGSSWLGWEERDRRAFAFSLELVNGNNSPWEGRDPVFSTDALRCPHVSSA